jgi:hypothetical protein
MKAAELSNVDVAVNMLASLGGAEKTIYSEHIAAKCYEAAPPRFSWRLSEYAKKDGLTSTSLRLLWRMQRRMSMAS